MIRMEAAGIYSWLPLGLRVLRKVAEIVRQEMDATGALEVSLPIVQPAELWQTSGRWEAYGPELQRFEDRRGRMFCLGPTHEEVICSLARDNLKSWRDLPICYYQIQTKYRAELRPRFGLLRCREFLMKDAYSFHLDHDSLTHTYDRMRQAYCRILDRLGLQYRTVLADSGSIGGQTSEEFQVLAEAGEDQIACSEGGKYAANLERAAAMPPPPAAPENAAESLREVATPDCQTISQVCEQLDMEPVRTVKTLIVRGASADEPLLALVLRGDHQLNEIKAASMPELASPLQMADEDDIRAAMGAGPGSLGPVGSQLPVLVDAEAAALNDFCCGANKDGFHYLGANWQRDAQWRDIRDLRQVVDGDPSPEGDGKLRIHRGIEVGHIFQLGQKYSDPMDVRVLDDSGKEVTPLMGCYGIGVSRIVAAAAEQYRDDKGLTWPVAMAPFQVLLVPLSRASGTAGAEIELATRLHDELQQAGVEVLLDDRSGRAGIKLADAELIGIPHQLVIGERNLAKGQLEYRYRRDGQTEFWPTDAALDRLLERLKEGG